MSLAADLNEAPKTEEKVDLRREYEYSASRKCSTNSTANLSA